MKFLFPHVPLLLLMATGARADVTTNSFETDFVLGTLTVQSSGGQVLNTYHDLYSLAISPALVSRIQADTTVPTFIQNNANLFATLTDFIFLTTGDVSAELLNQSGTLVDESPDSLSDGFTLVQNDLESIALGSVTSNNTNLLEQTVYLGLTGTNPSDPSQSVLADVIVGYYTESIVETVPTPEPAWTWLACLVLLPARLALRRTRAV